ncbi:hypothetical protein ABKA04_001804 [Annulohypoxylon sp. FPYF3050]
MAQAETEQLHPGDQHEIPSFEAHESSDSLKGRIKKHYEIASDYYYSLWGQHIHHGLFKSVDETKEQAQVNLINYLLEISALPKGSKILDVGCGIGGTSRFLAREHGAEVTGITISGRQVQIAKRLTGEEIGSASTIPPDDFLKYSGKEGKEGGKVRFLELDAEKMLEHFRPTIEEGRSFDCVETDIKPIEDGMLLPRLYTVNEYVEFAEKAGFKIHQKPIDISKEVAKTWDISWSLVSSPSLWAFAISQGRDGLSFLQAFRAMRRGYANGTFRYAVMCFEKP